MFEDTTLFDKFKSTESLVEKLDDIDNEILEKLTFLKEKIEDFSKEKLEKNKLSLNEILDKINTNGINNLTKEELTLTQGKVILKDSIISSFKEKCATYDVMLANEKQKFE